MKKTNSMRVAVLMLALTLITSCFVGGTFAKYTTAADAKDSARVAKFGVNVTANGSAFAKEYDAKDPTLTDYKGDVLSKSVVSINNDKVVAPGTSGDMAAFKITGEPEVAVEVKYNATLKLKNWEVDGKFYCPIVFNVGNEKIYQTTDEDTAADFIKKVEDKINAYSAIYQANTNFDTLEKAPGVDISWEWEFEGPDQNTDATVPVQTDVKDTALGDQAAADITKAGTIDLTIAVSVTQID